MRILSTWTAGAAALSLSAGLAVGAACKKQDDSSAAATAPSTTAYPPQAYPQQGYPQPQPTAPYAQPTAQPYPYPTTPAPAATPGYPTAQPAPLPAPTTPGAAPVASGQMAVPGPVAFQCTNDLPCGTHHCNTQYGKCAFPCQSATDCIAPNTCIMGLCVPGAPQAH